MMKYKVSMFNVCFEYESKFFLYNSFQGTKSICKISDDNISTVKSFL